MKKSLMCMAGAIAIGFAACTNESKTSSQATAKADTIVSQKTKNMKNIVSIVEIPTTEFSRAVKFYETLLDVKIEEVDMGGTQMGVLPSDGETVNVVLVKGSDYKPTTDGAVLYLNAGSDLQPTLDKVEPNGGRILVPKTEISPDMGFFALFVDTEGNKLGLHSMK